MKLTGIAGMLALALWLAAGCGGGGSAVPAPGQADGSALPALAELPAPGGLSARRVISAEHHTFSFDELAFAQFATMAGTELSLVGGDEYWSYAVFSVALDQLAPTTVTLGGNPDRIRLGVADYAAGTWQWFSGPLSSPGLSILPEDYQPTPDGRFHLAVASPPDAQCTVTVDIDSVPLDAGGSWNVLFWLAADNYLAPGAARLLNELEAVGSGAELNLLAGYDIDPAFLAEPVAGTDAPHFIRIVADEDPLAVNIAGDVANQSFARDGFNSADPAQLAEFAGWAADNFPADRTALVLWGIGDGWRTDGSGDDRAAAGILADHGDGGTVLSANAALAGALADAGLSCDLLVLDAGQMGHIETLYDWAPVADWAVATQYRMPEDGWPYADWLSGWPVATGHTPRAAGDALVEAVAAEYGAQPLPYYTAGLYNLGYMADVVGALSGLADFWQDHSDQEAQWVGYAIRSARQFGRTDWGALDLGVFANRYRSVTGPGGRSLVDGLEQALADFTTHHRKSPQVTLTGLSAWLPDYPLADAAWRAEYGALPFNAATDWLAGLEAVKLPHNVSTWKWVPESTVHIGWSGGAELAVDLVIAAPEGESGSTSAPAGLAGLVEFSADNGESGQAAEWAALAEGAVPGAYSINARYEDTAAGPAAVLATCWIEDSDGGRSYETPPFSLPRGGQVPLITAINNAVGAAAAQLAPGERLELSWSPAAAELDLYIESPRLRYGSPAFPAGFQDLLRFSPDSTVSGAAVETAVLSDGAASGTYRVQVYADNLAVNLPGDSAEVVLRHLDAAGGELAVLAEETLTAADASGGGIIWRDLALVEVARPK